MSRVDDTVLLQQFEPILRFTSGEVFFPMDVEPYIKECSLWVQRPGEVPEKLIPEKTMTPDDLADAQRQSVNAGFDAVYFMKFIEPLNIAEMARMQLEQTLQRKKDKRDVFRAGRGRLARVGYGSRFLDAIFSLTLFARGRVPGDTAMAAQHTYRRILNEYEHRCYYGRVIREHGWIALQYWFFYPYNNWRSLFFGVNDHEADWEQIVVYCYENEENEVVPEWVAYASHDFHGDDLRRRWDDPEIDRAGDHPVVYVAAGSHASYFQPGEYLTEIEIPFLRPLVNLVDRFNKARERALEEYQGVQVQSQNSDVNLFRIPFVDYARGDGWTLGPGQDYEWDEPRVLSEPLPNWVKHYRGLWGLYANDPLSGEDAPAGPMYNRDGSVRRAWYNPIGWAGLDKIPPPSRALDGVYERRSEIISRAAELRESIEEMMQDMIRLGSGAEAMRGQPHLKVAFEERVQRINELTSQIDAARASLTHDEALLEALDEHAEVLRSGGRGPLRAHITRAHHPIPPDEVRLGRIAEFWAATSTGLMMIAFVLLLIFQPESLAIGLIVMLGLFLVIEAGFRRWLGQLIATVTVLLALYGAGILLVDFFWTTVVIIVLLLGSYIMWENLREIWR